MSEFILQERTLGQMLDATVARFPDREALIYVGHDFRQTWSEFAATVDRLARGLMALGIQPGEKIALWATNVPYWVCMMFATARIGVTLVAVNTNYRDSELEYLIRQSECENFCCIDGFLDYVVVLVDDGEVFAHVPEVSCHESFDDELYVFCGFFAFFFSTLLFF